VTSRERYEVATGQCNIPASVISTIVVFRVPYIRVGRQEWRREFEIDKEHGSRSKISDRSDIDLYLTIGFQLEFVASVVNEIYEIFIEVLN
jgi:hypothetical protein